jgi:hypothetical protein
MTMLIGIRIAAYSLSNIDALELDLHLPELSPDVAP